MLPAKQNKVDLSQLTEEEKVIFRKFGRLPKRDLIRNKFEERKYFDSGDYELKKAGRPDASVGVQHPSPDKIPHAANASNLAKTSTASVQRESSLTQDATEEITRAVQETTKEAAAK
ncbi:hypothetical protein BDF22DRAFT_665588 [Syncephalis plumigaleata]|nr:hypothetical protein BDF22DRAFT_665588 [Syncephalis plumigaleata]